jgi:GntR family transcriptional regulator
VAGTSLAVDPTPLYFRLQQVLRAEIESLTYPPGSRLPAERLLGQRYGVSRITVRQALDGLRRAGLIQRNRGRTGGTFVCGGPPTPRPVKLSASFDALFSRRNISRIEILAFYIRSSNADVQATLQLSAGTSVRYVERILHARAGPVAYVRNFVPLPAGQALRRADLKANMLQEALRQRGFELAEVRDEIEASISDSHTGTLLRVGAGRPLLSLRRVFLGPAATPLNLTLMVIASDRYKMVLTLRPGQAD